MINTLSINNFTVHRGGKPVVKDISLGMESGSITALLGPNGAGKSSLVLGIAGVIRETEGNVFLNGNRISGKPPEIVRAAGLAAVPEGHHVLTDLTVLENFKISAALLPGKSVDANVEKAFKLFPELKGKFNQLAGNLSGGLQQMVAIGQAVVGKPSFILVDEMSLGLAPLVVDRLVDVVVELAQDNIGILLIEQYTHLALKIADKVHVMSQGKVTYSGIAAEVRDNPDALQEIYLLSDG